MLAFYDGRFLPEEEVLVSPFTRAFEYGAGFFTTLKFRAGRFYFLDRHLARLAGSLEAYGMGRPEGDLEAALQTLVERNALSEARIKVLAFDEGRRRPGVLIRCAPLRVDKTPRRLAIHPARRGDDEIFRHKAMCYLPNIRAHEWAERLGFHDCVFADAQGRVLETCFCNLFFIVGGRAATPPARLPLLSGIVRGELLRRGEVAGMRLVEEEVRLEDLGRCEGAVATNGVHGAVAVERIGDTAYSLDAARPLVELDL